MNAQPSSIRPRDLDLRDAALPGDGAVLPQTIALLLLIGASQACDHYHWQWISREATNAWLSHYIEKRGFAWLRVAAYIPCDFPGLIAAGLVEADSPLDSGNARLRITAACLEQLAVSRWTRKGWKALQP